MKADRTIPPLPSQDLFAEAETKAENEPLAARMRPRTLDEFIGQDHIIGPGRLLRRAIQADQLSSIILYGPPGTGKTTLAQIIANTTRARFLAINAVLAGVKDIREAIETAKEARKTHNQKTILFVDEVHRFNKAQQDALLPHVENGTLTLIGATTENPYFEVNKALVSRSRIFQLKPLEAEHVRDVVLAALANPDRGYGKRKVEIDPEALDHIMRVASGDARSALNALELAVETTPPGVNGSQRITLDVAEESIQRRAVLYDKDGDAHYDTISAFIKSVRGSDPDAALYWLSKMVYAGEDPRFLFRRMLILASEDVGLADPQALGVVSAAAQAFDYVGLPEGQFHLAQACLYLATAPKSNTTMAYYDALESVRREQQDEVPDHLKDASRDGEDLGHGKGYLYPHAYRDHWVAQQYLPQGLQGKVFYQPSQSGFEADIRERVTRNREAQLEAADQNRQETEAWGVSSKSRNAKVSSSWLDRAANQSSETLKQVRDEIFRLAGEGKDAGAKRNSLVLDLTGGTGFLTWEACRRCPAGGAWARCEDAGQLKAMEEWARHLEILSRPVFLAAPLDGVAAVLGATAQKEMPKFDMIVGMGLLGKTADAGALIESLRSFAAPEAKLVWAETNAYRSQGFAEILSRDSFDGELLAKVEAIEKSWRAALPQSPLDPLLRLPEINAAVIPRDFSARKHFSPAQIRKWFSPEAADRAESLLARFVSELSLRERTTLEGALLDLFATNGAAPNAASAAALGGAAGIGVEWRQSYDFLVVDFS